MDELRFASLMADNAAGVCRALAAYLTLRVGIPTRTLEDVPWQERERRLYEGDAHLGVVCGLQYARAVAGRRSPCIELLGAPVMRAARYSGRPIYFSDVVVRRGSAVRSLADLRGAVWAYNEPTSHSGYALTRYALAARGDTSAFFGQVIAAGSHQRSLALIREGSVDAAAIDSTVLERERRQHPEIADHFKVVEVLGPSPIPPVVVSLSVPETIRRALATALLGMHQDRVGGAVLASDHIERFVRMTDADYEPIRRMATSAERVAPWPT